MHAGDRIRLNNLCPWPERRGAEGTIVEAPNGPGVYPDMLGPDEVIVLLDDDPKGRTNHGTVSDWNCVVRTSRVDLIDPA